MRLKISAVEIWRVEGRRETVAGTTGQQQVNPLPIYEDYRPKPFREGAESRSIRPVSSLYLKIRTGDGLEGIYGPIDKEAAIVIEQQLRVFLVGKDPLAGEALWDQMLRLNRHSRRGIFMMAISAVDNTLWDLRGRYFQAPVYRLLGGPTRGKVNKGELEGSNAIMTKQLQFKGNMSNIIRYSKSFPRLFQLMQKAPVEY